MKENFSKTNKFKNKNKTKIRDRFGKQRKVRIQEKDSIEKFIEGYNEFIEE